MANTGDVRKKAKVVVAIDFGTTFSGYTFSPINSYDINQAITIPWGYGQQPPTAKTPTCLLLDNDKNFKAFGYIAQSNFLELDDEERKKHYYFDKFKMELHHQQDINAQLKLEDKTGKQMPAIDVFSLSLKYLKDEAVNNIGQSGLIESEEEIKYVLTVPAIWTPSSKHFMREAATKAGLVSLLIALEPEAAAIFCRNLPMNKFIGYHREGGALCGDALAREGTAFMVVDNGGGTVDIAVLSRDSSNALHEVHKATGGPWGGILFEQEFIKKLGEAFSISLVEEYKVKYPRHWFEFLSRVECAKRQERYLEGKETRILMYRSFCNTFMPEYTRFKYTKLIFLLKNLYFSDDKECLCLSSDFIKSLFEISATAIIDHMKHLVSTLIKEKVNLKAIFLVGGLSTCKLIQKQIKAHFNAKYRVLTPLDPVTAVMKGALMFCLKPDIIQTRISRATYGYDVCRKFDPEIHDPKKKSHYDDGDYCKDMFKRIVTVNEPIKYGDTRKSYVKPLQANQKQVSFTFYMTDRFNATYIDEPHVKRVGTAITVDSPDTSKGLDRSIEVAVRFGETEFKVSAIDIESGKNATAYITFV